MSKLPKKRSKRTRFAIYTRYSSDMQNELSLEAQETRCRKAIAERNGVVIDVFSDGAKTGWSLERNGFIQLRQAAERRKFDAVMFWKFDRLARNHNHAVMIKMLLRHEYGLKLFCVEGFSEDEDDSPYTAMMEQMLAVFSAFYSKNLSNETKRGKQQRAMNGDFNGSIAPIGFTLITKKEAAKRGIPAGLYIAHRLAAIVRRAFRMYSSGKYSDQMIAEWMNQRKEIQKLRTGKQPINKEMVRDMLQNRVYTGRVPYAETFYGGTLGQGKQSSRKRKEWYEGKHEGFISDELFKACQEVRKTLVKTKQSLGIVRTYILHDRVYCARCIGSKPKSLVDTNYGKMRPRWDHRREEGSYRCLARDRGYHTCEQGYVSENLIDAQVVEALSNLSIPAGFQERVEQAIQRRVEHADALQRMADLEEVVKRIDFSWEQGFLSPQEYVAKRQELKQQMESLRPVDYDDLMEAADLLENFRTYWDGCDNVGNPPEARKQLLAKIIDRVFVYDQNVLAVALHGDFSIVLDNGTSAPHEVVEGLKMEINGGKEKGASDSNSTCTLDGSDGVRTRDLRLDRPAC